MVYKCALPRSAARVCVPARYAPCGQSVQYAAALLGEDGLFKEDLKLLVSQGDAFGQQAFKKPHAFAKAFRPVLALLRFLRLHKLSALVFKLSDFFLDACDFFDFGLCHV